MLKIVSRVCDEDDSATTTLNFVCKFDTVFMLSNVDYLWQPSWIGWQRCTSTDYYEFHYNSSTVMRYFADRQNNTQTWSKTITLFLLLRRVIFITEVGAFSESWGSKCTKPQHNFYKKLVKYQQWDFISQKAAISENIFEWIPQIVILWE